jgi:uncharacterized protein YjiS (DUF1127 family)
MIRLSIAIDRAINSPDHAARASRHWAERPDTGLEALIGRAIRAGLPRAFSILGLWLRRLRHRRELARLTEAQLRDAGLDPAAVRQESETSFWRA